MNASAAAEAPNSAPRSKSLLLFSVLLSSFNPFWVPPPPQTRARPQQALSIPLSQLRGRAVHWERCPVLGESRDLAGRKIIKFFCVCLKTGQNHLQIVMSFRHWREEEIEYVLF